MVDTVERYRRFAAFEAAGSSPTYERLARAVAEDRRLLAALAELPPPKRQPNLLFASARRAGVPVHDEAAFVRGVLDRWAEVAGVMASRSTQTNEPARCGTFLPVLAQVAGPIAVIEVGCSAGLCLYPDRYAISYDRRPALVPSPVVVDVRTFGMVPLPDRPPDVVTRIGIDLHPLDVADPDDLRWLELLVWPEHDQRLQRLRAAAEVVAADPPQLVTGDAIDALDGALRLVPDGVTPVVFHSAVMNYLDAGRRADFAAAIGERPDVVWLANEAPGVLDGVATDLTVPDDAAIGPAFFVLSEGDGAALAIADPHGSWIRWP